MRVFPLIRKQRLMPFQRRYMHHSFPTNSRSAINTAQRLAGSTFNGCVALTGRTADGRQGWPKVQAIPALSLP